MLQISPDIMQKLAQIMHLSRATEAEATSLLQLGLAPFRGDRDSVVTLRKGMREGLVLSSVRNSPEVQRAVGEAEARAS